MSALVTNPQQEAMLAKTPGQVAKQMGDMLRKAEKTERDSEGRPSAPAVRYAIEACLLCLHHAALLQEQHQTVDPRSAVPVFWITRDQHKQGGSFEHRKQHSYMAVVMLGPPTFVELCLSSASLVTHQIKFGLWARRRHSIYGRCYVGTTFLHALQTVGGLAHSDGKQPFCMLCMLWNVLVSNLCTWCAGCWRCCAPQWTQASWLCAWTRRPSTSTRCRSWGTPCSLRACSLHA